jgi:hypothetical protein
MEKPTHIQPSIYLPIEDQIAANQAYLVLLRAWEAEQEDDK